MVRSQRSRGHINCDAHRERVVPTLEVPGVRASSGPVARRGSPGRCGSARRDNVTVPFDGRYPMSCRISPRRMLASRSRLNSDQLLERHGCPCLAELPICLWALDD
jgi:hypothetical protein